MQLDDVYGTGWLRRWHIDARGQAACWPPVALATTAQVDIDAITAANDVVRDRIEAVVALEAARRVRAGEEPDQYETYTDEDGAELQRETAAWVEWVAAGEMIDDADQDTKDLADVRADPPEDPEPMEDTYVPSPLYPTGDDVNDERERRVRVGTTVTVTGAGDIPLRGEDQDARNLQGLCTAAQLRIAAGDTTTVTPFRDAENEMHDLTPPQVVELWQGSAAYVSALYAASWDLKAEDPIPLDYTDDSHWP